MNRVPKKYQCPLCTERNTKRIQYGLIDYYQHDLKENVYYAGCAVEVDGANRYCPSCELLWRWQKPESYELMRFPEVSFLFTKDHLLALKARYDELPPIPPVVKMRNTIADLLTNGL